MNALIEFAEQGHYSISQAAKIAGVARSTIHRIVFGNPQRGTAPSKVLKWHVMKYDTSKGFLLGKELNRYFNTEI